MELCWFQSVHTVATVTTVRTSVIVPESRAMRRLESACVELEKLETTAVIVSTFTSQTAVDLLLCRVLCNDFVSYYILNKVVPYSITSIGQGADLGFLAVSPQVTLVINPVVGCRYFPPCRSTVTFPAKEITPWPIPNYTAWWWQRHRGLPKATT